MKLILNFKTPDVVHTAIQDAFDEEDELTEDEKEDLADMDREELSELALEAASHWVRYGEYLRVEIDTEAGTAKVLPCRR